MDRRHSAEVRQRAREREAARRGRLPTDDQAVIASYQRPGGTLASAAAEHGLSHVGVLKVLRRNGVETKLQGPRREGAA
ncbi:MAG TPA: hypothetical protein VEA35_00545 [Ramlibacter sp.]|nr:hypothetical protein [Ramlibacter sp.]